MKLPGLSPRGRPAPPAYDLFLFPRNRPVHAGKNVEMQTLADESRQSRGKYTFREEQKPYVTR